MATAPQSGQPVQVNGNQLGDLSTLLTQLLGSSRTATTNPGNTQALQQLLAQLQGADYSNSLQSVFQQASGQIPGMQAAFTNAVGARSGGNSAVQAALSKLLQDATLAGQKQLVDQQLANQRLQADAGGAIAQTTRGTSTTEKTKGSGAKVAALLAGMQGLLKITGSKDMQDLATKMGFTGNSAPAPVTGPVNSAAPIMGSTAGAVTGAAASPMMMGMQTNYGGVPPEWAGGVALDPQFANYSDQFSFNANELSAGTGMDPLDALIQVTGGFGTAPGIDFGGNDFQIDPGYVDPMNFY